MPEAANQNEPLKPGAGKLAQNINLFARLLREAGIPAGPGAMLDALEAAALGGMRSRDDFFWSLHAIFVKKHEHSLLFAEAFEIFWRRPKAIEQLMQLLFHQITKPGGQKKKKAGHRRLAEAMFDDASPQGTRTSPPELDLDARFTTSATEVLRKKDFEQMSKAEQSEAQRALRQMRLDPERIKTRRFVADARGQRIDMRRSFRRMLREGGLIRLARVARSEREPPLIILADISGSMSNYTRMFLHFLHAVKTDRARVHVFLFGTRLTNVTRELARRDVDEAMEKVSAAVKDWSGGTRIASALHEFNQHWGRRVLTQNAQLVLMTDGLERDDGETLAFEMARLKRSARRVIWLNPLLRYDGFEPLAVGIRAIMPHVDSFRPVHNLDSIAGLAHALTAPAHRAHDPRRFGVRSGVLENKGG